MRRRDLKVLAWRAEDAHQRVKRILAAALTVRQLAIAIDGSPEQPAADSSRGAPSRRWVDGSELRSELRHLERWDVQGDGRPVDGLLEQVGGEALLQRRSGSGVGGGLG